MFDREDRGFRVLVTEMERIRKRSRVVYAGEPAGFSNGYEVCLTVDRLVNLLAKLMKSDPQCDLTKLSALCIYLARGIDYMAASSQVPSRAQDLPLLLRWLSKYNNDFSLQAAVMVLLISIKSTCSIAWFSDKDVAYLLSLTKEIGGKFGIMEDNNMEQSYYALSISKVMSRYYPCIKMSFVLAYLEIKPGYDAFVTEFHVTRSMVDPAEEHIGLIIVQTDTLDTSSCIVTPPKANVLLNGKGVPGRNNVSMEYEPQIPTNVTPMLNNGINLLQAVGQFCGHYIIIIAFMHKVCFSGTPAFQDYVSPIWFAPVSDSDVNKGLTQVSLNCPISHKRIRTPVKGHLCKHFQCFDLDTFIETNSRKPLWRCPHCHQPVCYLDIRIDQNMAKILREAGENGPDMMISEIGTCRTDLKTNECRDQVQDEVQSSHNRKPLKCKSGGFLSAPPSLGDIKKRKANKDTATIFKFQSSDSEHTHQNFPNVSVVGNMPPELGINFGIKKNISIQLGNSFPSALPFVCSDTHKSVCHSSNFSAYTNAGTTQSLCSNFATSPVLSDAISLVSDKESINEHEENQVFLSLSQDQVCDYIRKHQGMLPVCSKSSKASEPQTSGFLSQFPRPGGNITALNTFMPRGAPSTNLVAPFVVLPARGSVDVDDCAVSGQQYPSLPVNPTTKVASSSNQSDPLTQNTDANDHFSMSGGPLQQVVTTFRSPCFQSRDQSFPRLTTNQDLSHSEKASCPISYVQPEPFHSRSRSFQVKQDAVSKQSDLRTSAQLKASHVQPGPFHKRSHSFRVNRDAVNKQSDLWTSTQLTTSMTRAQQFAPVQLQSSRPFVQLPRANQVGELKSSGVRRTMQPAAQIEEPGTFSTTENWKSSGRMRRSLTGAAYSVARDQLLK